MAKDKTITESTRGYNFDGTPQEFLKQITEFIEELPPTTTNVCIVTDSDYGDDYAVIEWTYTRPWTEEELERERIKAASNAGRRQLYEQLKKAFKDA